jgi:hypothetical protein
MLSRTSPVAVPAHLNVEKGRSGAASADKSHNWQEEDSWLELASAWTELAEAFEIEHRLSLN